MIPLSGALALNAVLHALVVERFGTKGNAAFLAYVFIYGALAVAVFLALPPALWATLVLAGLGLVGRTVTFNKVDRDKSLDRMIWVLDAGTVSYVAYLLFVH